MKRKTYLLLSVLFYFSSSSFSQEKDKKFENSSLKQLSQISENLKIQIDIPLPQLGTDNEVTRETCKYPNENIYPGKSLTPIISDQRRVNAILDLISKIAKCEQLPYKEDGQIFKNKEGKLPPKENGYYREYTLILPKDSQQQFYIGETQYTALPSLSERGPERIVIGGGTYVYYTPTHYASFILLDIGKTYGK
ncbi:MAG: hypothetical protein GX447_02450 [Elusimicrobia bacterium]|nr:hypothetical protein [Elusimicrobiota bacterium]